MDISSTQQPSAQDQVWENWYKQLIDPAAQHPRWDPLGGQLADPALWSLKPSLGHPGGSEWTAQSIQQPGNSGQVQDTQNKQLVDLAAWHLT